MFEKFVVKLQWLFEYYFRGKLRYNFCFDFELLHLQYSVQKIRRITYIKQLFERHVAEKLRYKQSFQVIALIITLFEYSVQKVYRIINKNYNSYLSYCFNYYPI